MVCMENDNAYQLWVILCADSEYRFVRGAYPIKYPTKPPYNDKYSSLPLLKLIILRHWHQEKETFTNNTILII
jgi:hypothetical protein